MNRQNFVIDFSEVIKYMLKKLKIIIVVALLFGVIGNTLFVVKNMKTGNSGAESESELAQKEQLQAQIGENESNDAKAAVKLYERYKKQYEALEEYVNDSMYMRIDPSNHLEAKIDYMVSDVTGEKNALNYAEYLKNTILSETVIEKLSNILKCEKQYVCDLISVKNLNEEITDSSSVAFCEVKLVLNNTSDARAMLEELSKILDSSIITDNQLANKVDVKQVSNSIVTSSDSAMFEKQQEHIIQLKKMKSDMIEIDRTFDGLQRDYYNILRKEGNTEGVEKMQSQEAKNKASISSSISVKGTALGLFGGVVLAILFFFCKYLIIGTIRGKIDFEENLKINLFGGCVLDSFEQEEIEECAQEILIALKKKNKKELCIFSSVVDDDKVKSIVESLKEWFEKKNISVLTCSCEKVTQVEKVPTSSGAIVLERCFKSEINIVNREKQICNMLGIDLLGGILTK